MQIEVTFLNSLKGHFPDITETQFTFLHSCIIYTNKIKLFSSQAYLIVELIWNN